jgi:uncharacterized membrane protein
MPAFYLTLVCLVLFVVALAITLLVNVPIDNQIKEWTIQTMPADWEAIRDRWKLYHTIRTFSSLIGLGLILIVLLSSSNTNNHKTETVRR